MYSRKELIRFEKRVAEMFEDKIIDCPVHLAGGNENILIDIFKNVHKDDYVFSTHRNHYHYLLHTGNDEDLLYEILGLESGVCKGKARSMHIIDHERHFYSSGIVAGCVAIACGVALALKMQKSKRKVWCFIGDGALDSGHTFEAIRYAITKDLPVTYVIEDNNRSCSTTVKQRWGASMVGSLNSNKVISYKYKAKYPHVGVGRWITF